MPNIDDGWVAVIDVASRLGIDPAHIFRQLDGEVRTDWAGRPCIPATRARQVVEGFESDRQRLAAWHAGRDDYIRRREAKRAEVYRRALEEANGEAWRRLDRDLAAQGMQDLHRQALPPPLQQEVWRKANEALAAWDAAHPVPADAADYGERAEYFERLLES